MKTDIEDEIIYYESVPFLLNFIVGCFPTNNNFGTKISLVSVLHADERDFRPG